ncbi:MAG: phosphotransferase family protein [Deltaproteobacteria bacterium]|nr:phosphotransferase family protein [Deltaproteobacteria bacterium]
MQQAVQGFIGRQVGQEVRVQGLTKLPGGAVKEIFSCQVILPEQTIDAVLRVERSAPLPVALSLAQEFKVMDVAWRAGVPVPKPLWYSADALAGPCCLMERVYGQALPSKILYKDSFKKARERLPDQMAKALAAIHAIPVEPELPAFMPDRGVAGEVDFYEKAYSDYSLDPHPTLELTLRWLRQNPPPERPKRLVHGDFRMGNLICDESGLQKVLDWELAHLGDPMEDFGWPMVMAWRFGKNHLPLAGLCQREEFFKAYENAGGETVDPAAVHFWEVFGNLKWAVITILQAAPFLNGTSNSIELASLGRKTVEVERQLIALLEDA